MRAKKDRVQVVVIGGGPAGSTVATLLAEGGLVVRLLEKETFPRYHIGESLIPETYWTFQRLGLVETLKASEFTRKYSVQFISQSGKPSRPFYFQERDPHESSVTWQVERAEFDTMMLDRARETSVDVQHGQTVERVLFDGGRAIGVRGLDAAGEGFEVFCDVVVDASGLHSILARQLGWLKPDPHLAKAAVFGQYENAHRDSGLDEGATLIIHTQGNRGWFWYIPLHRNRVSVGVVGAAAELLKGRGRPAEVLAEEIAACPAVAERLVSATLLGKVSATSDYSYQATSSAGHGHVLVGDAFGFLDPIYSSGILLALKSGELAADGILEAFAKQDFSGRQLGAFGGQLAEGMEAFRRLVYAFYTPGFSFAGFVSKHPEHREDLIRILIGDVFKGGFEKLYATLEPLCDRPDPQPLLGDGSG